MTSNVKVEAPPLSVPPPSVQHFRPQPATAKIFAPRTEDMNKGFFMFPDDEPGRIRCKDEDEDLTHLAPVPGDGCVPLDFNDVFGDFLDGTYCPLLTTDHELSSSSCPSRTSGDPFFSYRDDYNSAQSPCDLAKTPDDGSLPSLCSPEHGDDQMGLMDLNMDSGGSELDEDLTSKAPYIPLEDLPLHIPTVDLLWEEPPSPHRPESSTLAELLRTSPPDPGRPPPRSNKRTDHDWFKDTGQSKSAKLSLALPKEEQLLRKAPPGAGPPSDRAGMKRSHGDGSLNSLEGSKRPKNKLSPQLLQQLVDSPSKHSVLMNLLGNMPRATFLEALTEFLNKLYLANNGSHNEEVKRQEDLRLRSISTSLLEPNATAIPSLLDLSQRDCEVNAPVDKHTLLRGHEIITALDNVDSNYIE